MARKAAGHPLHAGDKEAVMETPRHTIGKVCMRAFVRTIKALDLLRGSHIFAAELMLRTENPFKKTRFTATPVRSVKYDGDMPA